MASPPVMCFTQSAAPMPILVRNSFIAVELPSPTWAWSTPKVLRKLPVKE